MRGWFADLFRLFLGLLYWNIRKSWFQHRRGQSRCPCQNRSDSGRAYETGCDACMTWARQGRFRRVCPLLVETKQGLRCSADTAAVRPFWSRALGYYGAALLLIYLIAVLAVFIFLRTIGYPVSIVHVGLPPLWHKVGQARGWFFMDRSTRAFAAGRTAEGLLYLANAYEFDPANYAAGIALAKNTQAGQPSRSDQVFQQLMRDHPDKRGATAQDWFRALLARGSFEQVATLARDEALGDTAHGDQWIRALVFATRRTSDDGPLRDLLATKSLAATAWHPLIETELLVRAKRTDAARNAVTGRWPPGSPRYSLIYRVTALIDFGDPLGALDLLESHPRVIDDEASVTLRLDAYAAAKSRLIQTQVDALLAPRLELPTVKILCAQLIRHPDAAIFEQLCRKVEREPMPLNSETAGAWFSLLCSAGAVGDKIRLHQITAQLQQASSTPFVALSVVEAFFRGETQERRITSFLPLLPLPLEVTYALLERYPPEGPAGENARRKT